MCSDFNRGVKRRGDLQPFASQSRKSRRLECQFTPKCEEDVVIKSELRPDQYVADCAALRNDDVPISDVVLQSSSELPGDSAIILFQPADLLMRSPSCPKLEIKVHPDLVDALRKYQYPITNAYTQTLKDQTLNFGSTSSNLAVIPWIDRNIIEQSKHIREPMEADCDSEMMDTEECKESTNISNEPQHHLQPQHCLPPQVSQNKAAPVHWC